jgi:hypothetical protein
MKAISLTQPWASLVAIGAKRIETRAWSTSYRGPMAIHAAKSFPRFAKDLCLSRPFFAALGWPSALEPLTQAWLDDNFQRTKDLPLGCVLATARLADCLPTVLIPKVVRPFTEREKTFGNYEPGRHGFLLEDVVQLAAPIPAKGALGLWDWEPSQ